MTTTPTTARTPARTDHMPQPFSHQVRQSGQARWHLSGPEPQRRAVTFGELNGWPTAPHSGAVYVLRLPRCRDPAGTLRLSRLCGPGRLPDLAVAGRDLAASRRHRLGCPADHVFAQLP